MVISESLSQLIDAAAKKVGSQARLARTLGLLPQNLAEMKHGKRAMNWRLRGHLRATLGEEPTRAFVEAITEDLEKSENPDEQKAAAGFRAMLAAFPEGEEPASEIAGGDGGIRTLDEAQHPILP